MWPLPEYWEAFHFVIFHFTSDIDRMDHNISVLRSNIFLPTSEIELSSKSPTRKLLETEAPEDNIVKKFSSVMDLLWSSFRRGWTSKIPNTKSYGGRGEYIDQRSIYR